ncbi:S9 family peptidase [Hyphobacterium marinum]|uniref:S9 family peptidase n=1 Tax=Hyphobacterium marinum TaxID=3116574 RepID=A0ABU7LV84_9PROT|nr:S9 family peptidase [Hyphobacterium sp. Y6023]MEE2565473.1 S9 family peptidase [Hyphobacterium sp. Y6023]
MLRFVLCGLVFSLVIAESCRAQVLVDYVRELHLEDFLAESRVSRPRLSPDGTRIAYYDQGDHESQGNRLTVRDLDAPRGSGYVRADFGEFRILGVSWANDERLLVTLGVPGSVRIYRTDFDVQYTRVLSFSSRTLDDPVILFEGEGRRVERNLFNIQLHEVADILPGQPDYVLMPAYRSQALHLWRVNILTGEADIVERGNNRTARWYTGPDGRAVMRVDVSSRGRRVSVFTRNESGRWRRSATYRTNELSEAAPEFDWAGASDDPGQIYVFASPDETGLTGVYLYDLESGEYIETAGSHDRVDVTGTMIHPRTRRYLGYSYIEDRLQIEFADETIARHYRGIDNFFGGEVSVMPRDYSPSGRMIVEVSGPREPGVYYLYDEQAASIEPLYSSRPRLAPDALADVDIIRYAARDGLDLTGYLTIPEGGATRTTPLVVMPHGGPEMRDVYDFDIFAQYLALNGYAVFQPNFRGSSGYGEAFARAGYRQWGAAMQDDITDGVHHLISRGRADPDRICIMGFSYGGYAALMGGATTPDLYQCVIAGSSVTDLPAFVDYWRSEDNEEALEYWTEAVGDPRTESDRLRAHSPVNLAANFTVPVLLFHGDNDAIVPVEQSRDMARALEDAGVVHHYEEFRGGRHSLSLEGAEVRSILVRSTEFLDRMIGDLRGSGEVFAGEPADDAAEEDEP